MTWWGFLQGLFCTLPVYVVLSWLQIRRIRRVADVKALPPLEVHLEALEAKARAWDLEGFTSKAEDFRRQARKLRAEADSEMAALLGAASPEPPIERQRIAGLDANDPPPFRWDPKVPSPPPGTFSERELAELHALGKIDDLTLRRLRGR